MLVRTDVGVWMNDESRCESVARAIAVECMMALEMDHIDDFRTRDKIIVAISGRINRALDEVSGFGSGSDPRRVLETHCEQSPGVLTESREQKIEIEVEQHVLDMLAREGYVIDRIGVSTSRLCLSSDNGLFFGATGSSQVILRRRVARPVTLDDLGRECEFSDAFDMTF